MSAKITKRNKTNQPDGISMLKELLTNLFNLRLKRKYELLDEISFIINDENETEKKKLEILYKLLNILNQKASGIIAINSLWIATVAALNSSNNNNGFSLYLIILPMFAILFASTILSIKWPFYDKIDLSTQSFEIELTELERVVNKRNFFYNISSFLTKIFLFLVSTKLVIFLFLHF